MVLLTGFGLGCILIQIVILMRDFWRFTPTRIYSALLVMAGLLLLIPHIDPQWRWIAWDMTTATPALFWWLCQVTFSKVPDRRTPWVYIALFSFLAPALGRQLGADTSTHSQLHLLLWELPRVSEYLLVLKGGWEMLSTWSSDLVQERRRLRGWVLGIIGLGILGITFGLNAGLASELFIQVTVCACALASAGLMLGGRSLVLMEESQQLTASDMYSSQNPKEVADQEKLDSQAIVVPPDEEQRHLLAYRLNRLMASGFYRTEGLTLRKLSLELDAPVHKTRALINGTLGYRNFSDYLNQLRITEARTRLRAEPDTPVLNIALDVGYRNISSFNRTFKDLVDSTPTEYRKNKVQDLGLERLATSG